MSSYQLAGVGPRFVALIIDGILGSIIAGALGANDRWFLGGVIGFLVTLGYQWFFLTRNNGQTPGKMLLGIRVIKVDGTPITGIDATLRYLGYAINSAIMGIGWLWALIDPERQGWHDKLARTYVVLADRNDTVVMNKSKNEF
ncbi:MAG: RDD family protein [Anaerolineae bacterium]|jgi:uncharacterized RDD family membrane protein YckC|nr:RDD family protein [Anaerolineae bacterium]